MELDYQAMLSERLSLGNRESIAALRARALDAKRLQARLIAVIAKRAR